MTELKEKHIFYVDSDLAEGGNSSNFTFKINIPDGCTRCSVLQASIPKSFYLIQSGNNTFTLQEGAAQVTVTVPPGNYSMRAFKTVLVPLLNAASPNVWTYAMTYPGEAGTSAETGKFAYTVTGNGGSQPSFIFPVSSTLYRQMGFNHSSTNTFVGSAMASVNVLDFNQVRAMYILSDLIQPTAYRDQSSNVLQEIFSLNDVDFSRVGFLNPAPHMNDKPLQRGKSVFTFTITDNDNTILELNGQQVNISICMW